MISCAPLHTCTSLVRGKHCSHHISTNPPLLLLHRRGLLWGEPLVRLHSTGHLLPEPGHDITKPWRSTSEIICPRSRSKLGHSQLRHQEQVSCRQFWLTTAGNGISFDPYDLSIAAKTSPFFCGWAKHGYAAVPKVCSWRGSSSKPFSVRCQMIPKFALWHRRGSLGRGCLSIELRPGN